MIRLLLGLVPLALSTGAHAQTWRILQFNGTESFSFDIHQTTAGTEATGTLDFSLTTGANGTTAHFAANIGETACGFDIPADNAQAVIPVILMRCAEVAPIALAMVNPSFLTFFAQPWAPGTRMDLTESGVPMSFAVSEPCSFGGERGWLGEITSTDMEVSICADPEVPLPLMVRFDNKLDNQIIVATLTRFTR